MVNFQWSDYSGTFNQPASITGITNAEFNLKLGIVPIPFLGMEGAVQLDHAVIPLIEARMNDATNMFVSSLSGALYNNPGGTDSLTPGGINYSTINNQALVGLPLAVDDTTNGDSYGGISRSANTWWKSTVVANVAVDPTRNYVLREISRVVKAGNEVPTMGVCGMGTWTKLATDYMAQERYIVGGQQGTANTAFEALMVGPVPIYADPFLAEGTLYLLNTNYLNLYIHQDAGFAFTGFQSTLPNFQLGYVGAVVLITELVNVKPITMSRTAGWTNHYSI